MWFSAKCIFRHTNIARHNSAYHYEERVVLIESESFDWAIMKAEQEAKNYADEHDCEYLNFVNCFHLFEDRIGDRSEIYSLMRHSDLEPSEYITKYYDDGTECSQKTGNDDSEEDMDAELFAIGKFSKNISNYLEYNKKIYKNLDEGSPVITSVFYTSGESSCKMLSECFGAGILDVGQHAVNPQKADIFKLKKLFDNDEIKKFAALRDAGFEFYMLFYFDDDGEEYYSKNE